MRPVYLDNNAFTAVSPEESPRKARACPTAITLPARTRAATKRTLRIADTSHVYQRGRCLLELGTRAALISYYFYLEF